MEQNKSIIKNVLFTITAIIFAFVFIFGIYFLCISKENNSKIFIDKVTSTVVSEISGKITELNTQEQDLVKKGEILVKIDSTEYEKELENAQKELDRLNNELKLSDKNINNTNKTIQSEKNNIEKAKLELENANSDYIRYKNAYQDGSVTKKDMNKAIENLKIARQNYNSAQDSLKTSNKNLQINLSKKNKKYSEIKMLSDKINQAKLNLSYTNIISPVDGKITNLKIKAGEYVKAFEPICEIISDNSYIISEYKKNNKNIKPNQKVLIRLKNPNLKLKGIVESVYPVSTIQCIKAPCIDKNAKTGVKIIFDEDISKYNIDENTKVYVKIK